MKTEANEIKINGETYVRKNSLQFMPNIEDGKTYCIVRTDSAGVFAGWVDRKSIKNKCGTVYCSRRIHHWEGAASLSQLSVSGTSSPNNCRFPCVVPETDLTEIIETIPCSNVAKISIEGVPLWES